jgi:hypothetical protein
MPEYPGVYTGIHLISRSSAQSLLLHTAERFYRDCTGNEGT